MDIWMKAKTLIVVALILFTAGAVADVQVSNQEGWNEGNFSGTSADINDNSGNLGLGYRNGTSSDSLIGYWRLDRSVSGSGGTVLDYSGSGRDGTARNGVNTGSEGVFSTNTFAFDGTDDKVTTADIDLSEHTLSFWLYLEKDSTNNWDMILANGDGDASQGGRNPALWLNNDGTNTLHFKISDCNNNNEGVDATSPITSQKWHHIAQTYDPDTETQKVYINGELDSTDNICAPIGTSNNPFTLGKFRSDKWAAFPMKLDEVMIYNRSLTESEVKRDYFRGNPFKGNYSRQISSTNSTTWKEVEIETSTIPTNTDVDAVFRALDSSDNVVDEQVIDLQEGKSNYSLDVSDSEKAEVVFNGSSSDVTSSWEVNGFKVFTGSASFCDLRGSENECVVDSIRQLEANTYDVISIFESRSTAVFEAFSGTSILNVSNSSRISGFWKGSFDIRSTSIRIEPGASFIPQNGRIIIGE